MWMPFLLLWVLLGIGIDGTFALTVVQSVMSNHIVIDGTHGLSVCGKALEMVLLM